MNYIHFAPGRTEFREPTQAAFIAGLMMKSRKVSVRREPQPKAALELRKFSWEQGQ